MWALGLVEKRTRDTIGLVDKGRPSVVPWVPELTTPSHKTNATTFGSRFPEPRRRTRCVLHVHWQPMHAAVPPTGPRRVRRLQSPSVKAPRRLAPPLPRETASDVAPPGREPSLSPRRDVSPRRSTDDTGVNAVVSTAPKPLQSVRVVVRCRPMNAAERSRGESALFRFPAKQPKLLQVVSVAPNSASTARELVRSFQFDLCAGGELSQGQFFRGCGVTSLLESVVEGYLATVFAYGQTGSGKTYTMSGLDELLSDTRVEPPPSGVQLSDGLTPRALQHLFTLMEATTDHVRFVVRASYCEIYNEQVFDLLHPAKGALNVRWNARAGFYVQDLLVVRCDSLADVLAVTHEGHRNRRVGANGLNGDSSRSHSILTVHVDRTEGDDGHDDGVTRYGKISFVDLAGSERLRETRAANAEETSSINRSLLTLGKVISALAAGTSASTMGSNTSSFVPYRDSKLTKLLMDSLGGQSLTLMIACVSPAASALEDTLSTLNYATRAKNIRNQPTVQVDPVEFALSALKRENHELRVENEALRARVKLTLPRVPSLSSVSSSQRLPLLGATGNVSPTNRSGDALRNQFVALQEDHEKLVLLAAATEKRLRELKAENEALKAGKSVGESHGSPRRRQETVLLREQVQQLQQREQELMQALSRRSRGKRDVQL